MARRRTRRRKKTSRSRSLRGLRVVVLMLAVAGLGAAGYLLYPFWVLSGKLAESESRQPSRLYGAPRALSVGEEVALEALAAELEAEGYRALPSGESPWPGSFVRAGDAIRLATRPHPTPEGPAPPALLSISAPGGRVARLEMEGVGVRRLQLEPPVLASYYGADLIERRPVALGEIPEDLVLSVLAAEDAGFFEHPGFSASGILRAAWANARDGQILQGGSTLTQQLVKNEFLTHERSWGRKARELVLALLIEARYDKRTILRAYLNGIYWGHSGPVQLVGVGAAAWAYFAQPAVSLDLPESALLAGAISSPGKFSPWQHPEAAMERRNRILDRLGELGWVESSRLEAARAAPLGVVDRPLHARAVPFFSAAAADEAARRFGVEELEDRGFALLSTLRARDQREGERAVAEGLSAIGSRPEDAQLEAALISVDPNTGEILAYVGGRDFARSQFDRVALARRQTGSAFKPVVYAAAFASGVATPATLLEDAPLTVKLGGRRWSPRNSDGEFRGWVSARRALERSLNVPTVRLGLQVGLPKVIETTQRMGIQARLQPVPSLVLGAFEVRPIELVSVYATLAAQGRRFPVHGLRAVLGPRGEPVGASERPTPTPALSPQVAYLVTSVLRGVLDVGTARSARSMGFADPLAGKTGTSNDRRDSWFAGYSPDRATLVWVGRDDNAPTRFTGSRGALPLWVRFTAAVRPPGGYPPFEAPPGIVMATIDPESGELALAGCPQRVVELFLEGRAPELECSRHGGGRDPSRGRIRAWLDRVLGGGGEED